MPLPLAPIASLVLRYGTVALATWAVSRRIGPAPTRQGTEDALDRVAQGCGASLAKDRQQLNLTGRWRRVVRLGQKGPGIEVEATGLGRLRFRKI